MERPGRLPGHQSGADWVDAWTEVGVAITAGEIIDRATAFAHKALATRPRRGTAAAAPDVVGDPRPDGLRPPAAFIVHGGGCSMASEQPPYLGTSR